MNANDQFTAANKAILELNLDPIKTKLMHVASGEGWSLEKANSVEKEYRRFLCLMKMFPEEDTAPLVDVDTFWHYHILDTMKYAADCEQVFGYFLHHDPHIGLGESEEEDQLRFESGDRMRELYEATFGEAYPGWSTGEIEAAVSVAGSADEGVNARATGIAAGIAFSAGPTHNMQKVRTTGIAFSAGPTPNMQKARAAGIAFSAGPTHGKLNARAAGIAFSAGPGQSKLNARATGMTAYCASPLPPHKPAREAAATAYYASPHQPANKAVDIAYCASTVPPHSPAENPAGVAYCAGPGHSKLATQA